MRRAPAALALAAWLAAGAAAPLAAQTVRNFATTRQLHGETRLRAEVDYAAGSLTLTPGAAGDLYAMQLAFDPARYAPLSGFDASAGAVRLGVAPVRTGVRVAAGDSSAQNALVTFSPRVDLSLDLTLGAVDAAVELGGLRLTDLRLQSGASRTTLRFSRPNPTRCDTATIEAGAAELAVLGLGNSRCERLVVEGGIGRLTLDFAGAWRDDSDVSVRMTVGELVLRLPRAVGVRLTLDRFLASFQPAGLVQREGAWVSPEYGSAPRTLDIALTTAVGGVRVEWID